MKLTLNVYRGGKVQKTYSTDTALLTTGVCEDLLQAVDIDKFIGGGLDDKQLGVEILRLAVKSFGKFKPFIKDIFPDITDEEYKHTSIKEVGSLVYNVIKSSIDELFAMGGDEKN